MIIVRAAGLNSGVNLERRTAPAENASPLPAAVSAPEARYPHFGPSSEPMSSLTGAAPASYNGLEVIVNSYKLAVSQVATATIASGGPSPGELNEGVIQPPEVTPADQLDYPEPIERPVEDPAYPLPQFQPALSNIRPFGTAPSDDNSRPIESIGGNFDDLQAADADTSQETSSTVFLWLGFIVALMIFITGVYGSIVLFTRQRSSGE